MTRSQSPARGTARVSTGDPGRAGGTAPAGLHSRYVDDDLARHGSDQERVVARAAVPVRPAAPDWMDDPVSPGLPGPPTGPRPPVRPAPDKGKQAKKRKRRRRLVAFLSVGLMLTGFMVLAGTYYFINVPLPSDFPAPLVSTIYYADGKTPLAKQGVENRTLTTIEKVPKHLQHAVVSAEDRSFYTNSGVSFRGIIRAAWNNLTDDDTQGASTIAQQYVRNAFLTQERSFSRKTKEAVMAIKLNRQYSKDEILEFYLNTVYFGRGAYGIEAASQAYFAKSVDKITLEEGAFLAAVIRTPAVFEDEPAAAKDRWRWVLHGMSEMKWLDRAKADSAVWPEKSLKPKSAAGNVNYGADLPAGITLKAIKAELNARGISDRDLVTKGYKVFTTIDPTAQRAAEDAAKLLATQAPHLATGIVAVEPNTGKVRAYYGGPKGTGEDYAKFHQPGSSFKVFPLATAIDEGFSINSYWNGSSPQRFPGRASPLKNSGGKSMPNVSLTQATVHSLNTAYYALTQEVGREKVIELAHRSGINVIKDDSLKPIDLRKTSARDAARKLGNEVGFGQYQITVLDQASGFATFANNGVYTPTHFVDRVVDAEGQKVFENTKPKQVQAFSADAAADATHVLEQVVQSGSNDLRSGRRSAGKTGTWQFKNTDQNAHAWMAGYTPQIAAAVWVGNKGDEAPIKTKNGRNIFGAGLPGQIWKKFMDQALDGKKEMPFPEPKFIGDESVGNGSSPAPSESASPFDPRPPKPSKDPSATPSTEPSIPFPRPSRSRRF